MTKRCRWLSFLVLPQGWAASYALTMAQALKVISGNARVANREKLRYVSTEFRVHAKDRERGLLARLKRTYKEQGIALYLGAGVSASAGFPDWKGLIRLLLGSIFKREAYGDEKQQLRYKKTNSWPWPRETFERTVKSVPFQNNRPLIMLARMLREHLKRDLPTSVAAMLYWESDLGGGGYLADTRWLRRIARDGLPQDLLDLVSSPLIDAIAEISTPHPDNTGVKAIVNYNFDDLVDEVIRYRGRQCSTVGAPADRMARGALPCYHVHGVLGLRSYASYLRGERPRLRTRGDFVFSEEEYHRQYAEPFRWSNLVQTSLLGSLDGLFIGLSLEDPNIRRLLDSTHRQYPRRSNYAILRRQRPLARAGRSVKDVVTNLFEGIESDSFADIGVRVLWGGRFRGYSKTPSPDCRTAARRLSTRVVRIG